MTADELVEGPRSLPTGVSHHVARCAASPGRSRRDGRERRWWPPRSQQHDMG